MTKYVAEMVMLDQEGPTAGRYQLVPSMNAIDNYIRFEAKHVNDSTAETLMDEVMAKSRLSPVVLNVDLFVLAG